MDLTYPHTHLGNGPHALYLFAQGKIPHVKQFLGASLPKIVLGVAPLERSDGDSLIQMITDLRSIRGRIGKARDAHPDDVLAFEEQPQNPRRFAARFGRAAHAHTIAYSVVAPGSAKSLGRNDGMFHAGYSEATSTQGRVRSADTPEIIHAYASTPGAYDLGFYPGRTSILGGEASAGSGDVLQICSPVAAKRPHPDALRDGRDAAR